MASRVVDILLEQGRQRAAAIEAQAAIWGGAVQQLGQIPGQMIQQGQQQKQQALKDQQAKQNLAIGAQELQKGQEDATARAKQRAGDAEQAAAVQELTTVDPEGIHVTDHQGVVDRLMSKGFASHAEHYMTVAPKQQELMNQIQADSLANRAKMNDWLLNQFGDIPEAPPEQQADLYTKRLSMLPPVAKQNQAIKALPPQYPGTEAFTGIVNGLRTEADRSARQKTAAAQALAAAKERETEAKATAADAEKRHRDDLTEAHARETERLARENLARETARDKAQAQYQQQEIAVRKAEHPPGGDQNKLEQQYRTVLQRAMSSRSGGLGLEDQKVQQANHLLALLHQTYDPKTDTYNIPKVLQGELSAGLARLVAPGGNVGVEMMREFNQRTAKGDIAGALTYITGQPVASTTQGIATMLKDSIERQGTVAQENREGEMRYLRGLAPTELDESRRQALEKTTLNPLRLSRVIQNQQTGERKLQVSLDGGETWK